MKLYYLKIVSGCNYCIIVFIKFISFVLRKYRCVCKTIMSKIKKKSAPPPPFSIPSYLIWKEVQEATGPHCSPEQPFLMCIFAKNFRCKTFLNEAWDSWSANDNAHFINFFYYLCFFLFKINILRNVKNGGYDIIVFFYCKVCKKTKEKMSAQ